MFYLQTTKLKYINTYYGKSNCVSNKISDATPIETIERAKALAKAYAIILDEKINVVTLTPTIVTD